MQPDLSGFAVYSPTHLWAGVADTLHRYPKLAPVDKSAYLVYAEKPVDLFYCSTNFYTTYS